MATPAYSDRKHPSETFFLRILLTRNRLSKMRFAAKVWSVAGNYKRSNQ
ncbi:hypothetical protein MKJ04_06920 [Pontibacter sp. E15-1]|nr:hypothetical protein [Pontibacter sp. E15-1]MCJ8164574.1 hypothetical protein [Pontibacter sp. E15-1]